ncbi:hypothetical protein BJX99DRAFT_254165 [Aspergillus californicus]
MAFPSDRKFRALELREAKSKEMQLGLYLICFERHQCGGWKIRMSLYFSLDIADETAVTETFARLIPLLHSPIKAVQQVTRSLAAEWGSRGVPLIRVNSLSPGYIRTAATAEALQKPGMESQSVGDNTTQYGG